MAYLHEGRILMAKKVLIRDLKHHCALCSGKDVVTDSGDIVLIREDVIRTWMKIEAKQTSMFSPAGYNIMENRERQTHLITLRMRRDLDISSAAWIYEERAQSGARWFKVLGIKDDGEDGDFMTLSARLIEKGDSLVPPVDDGATGVGIRPVAHGVRI